MILEKIDIHVHCSGPRRVDIGPMSNTSISDLLDDVFPETGVERGVLMTAPTPLMRSFSDEIGAVYVKANEDSRRLCEEYPNRFSWMCNLDPRVPELQDEQAVYDLLKSYKEAGAVGVGEAVAHLWVDSPEMQRVYRCLEKLDMPILMHMDVEPGKTYGLADDPGLPRLEKMLAAYPKLTFIGHSQVFWSEISGTCTPEERGGFPVGPVTPGRVEELMDKYPNLSADLSAMSGYNALTRTLTYGVRFLEQFQDRLMYGSDCTLPRRGIYTASLLDSLAELGVLSKEAHEKIVRDNAVRLFGLA